MLRGLYTAATGMMVQREKMNVLTNNIVNASTTGFKKDGLLSRSFAEVIVERTQDPYLIHMNEEVGPYSFGTHIDEIYTDFSEGSIEATSKQTDLAIAGDGFFAVETPDGERYTRDGHFFVSQTGELVTADGYYVLGRNGRLHVGAGEFAVDGQGKVAVDGEARDSLRIVRFEEPGGLRKQGDNLYSVFPAKRPRTRRTAKSCRDIWKAPMWT